MAAIRELSDDWISRSLAVMLCSDEGHGVILNKVHITELYVMGDSGLWHIVGISLAFGYQRQEEWE